MNKNQNVRRVLSLLFVMVMLVSMMVVGTVTASAAVVSDESAAGAKVVSADGSSVVFHDTLKNAIASANDGDTVVMLKDVTLGTYVQGASDAAITITKAITLDGNGFTLTSKAGRAINVGVSNNAFEGTVKIENLTIKQYAGRNSSDQKRCINILGIGTNVEVTNCNLQLVVHYANGRTLTSYVAGVQIYGANSTATINGSTISTIYGIVNYGVGSTFNIKNSTIDKALYCAWINAETTVNVENCDISTKTDMGTNNLGVAFLVQAGNVEVSVDAESSITVLPPVGEDGTATGGQAYAVYSSASAETPAVIDIQATIEKTDSTDPVVYLPNAEAQVLKDGEYVMYYTVQDAVDNLEVGDKIEGLTVSQEAIDSVLDNAGLKMDENGNVAKKGVAQFGDTVCETLAEALKEAPEGATITLLDNVNENVTITKSVTINGAKAGTEGKLVDDRYAFTGKITINGNSTKVTIECIAFNRGNIVQSASSSTNAVSVKNCSFKNGTGYAIETAGLHDLTIEGCKSEGQSLLYVRLSTTNITVKYTTVDSANYVAYYLYGTSAYFEEVTATNMTGYGILAMNYGSKTITLKNCSIEINNPDKYYAIASADIKAGIVDTFIFEGTNTANRVYDAFSTNIELAEGATLAAPAGLQITPAAGFTRLYHEGVYSLVKTAILNGYLTLGSAIDVNFVYYGDKTLVNDVEVVVTYGEKTYKLGLSNMYVTNGEYVYNLKGVFSAKQMADEFTVVVMYKGNAISKMYVEQSVKSIANTTLEIEGLSVEAKNLIVALLNYGAAAQEAFDYNASNLANAGPTVESTAEDVKLAEEKNNYTDEDNSYYGASVNLKNELQFNFKFFADMVPGAAKAVVTIGEGEGATELATVTTFGSDFKKNRDLIVVTVNVAAAQANEVMYCTFYDADGNAITTAGDSLLSYCVRAYAGLTDMKENNPNKYKDQTCKLEFYQALANYVVAAHGYATTENN